MDHPAPQRRAEVELRGRPAAGARPRRDRIVQAAVAVWGRCGYFASSLKDVAREAGVAPGLLHYYFTSKEDLLSAVVEELDRDLTESWRRALEGVEDPLERIPVALDAMESGWARRPELRRLLVEVYVAGLAEPAVRDRCRALRGHFVAGVETEVRRLLGVLPAYTLVPPVDLAAAVTASLEGISLAALVEGRDPSAHLRALKVMLLSLVVSAHLAAGREAPLSRLGELVRPR